MPNTAKILKSFRLQHRPAKFLSSTIALLISSVVYAAPEIQEISIDATQIEIKGIGFGEGPRVALFEDFNEATMASDFEVKFNPSIGVLAEQTGTAYVQTVADSDDQILIVRDSQLGTSKKFEFSEDDDSGVHGKKHFQEIYVSYSEKDFRDFPGPNGSHNSFSDISSAKPAWMMFGGRGDVTSYAVSQGSPAGHDIVFATWTGSGFLTGGNNTRMSPSFWHPELTNNWAFQDWNTISFHAKLNPKDPYGDAEGFISFVNRNFYYQKQRVGNLMSDQTSQGVPYPFWDRIKFYPWIRIGDSDVKRAVDNIYVAVGKYANARVIFTDNPILDKSRVLVHALPVNWTDSSITVKIPKDSRNPSYIHVVDSTELSSNGKFVCSDCPNPAKLNVN